MEYQIKQYGSSRFPEIENLAFYLSSRFLLIVPLTCVLMTAGAMGEETGDAGPDDKTPPEALPLSDPFKSLIADPKEPHFFQSYLRTDLQGTEFNMGTVGFGEYFGFYRGNGLLGGDGLQLGLSGVMLSQFNLDAPSANLLNTDFVTGCRCHTATALFLHGFAFIIRARTRVMKPSRPCGRAASTSVTRRLRPCFPMISTDGGCTPAGNTSFAGSRTISVHTWYTGG